MLEYPIVKYYGLRLSSLIGHRVGPVKLTDTVTVNRRGPVNRSLLFWRTRKVSLPSLHQRAKVGSLCLSLSLTAGPRITSEHRESGVGRIKVFSQEIKGEKTKLKSADRPLLLHRRFYA